MLRHYLVARREGAAAAQVLHLHQPVRHQLHAARADRGRRRCSITPSARTPTEPRQDRTLYVERAVMYGPHSTWIEQRRLQAARQLRAQPARRRAAVALRGRTHRPLVPRRQQDRRRPEADRRRVLAHPASSTSSKAGPFGTADVAEARFVAVINATHAAAVLRRPAGGRPDHRSRRPAVPRRWASSRTCRRCATMPFADIWVPYTTAKTDAYKREVMGDWHADGAGPRHGGDAGHPRGVQFAAAPRRAARPEALRGDRGAVRDQVRRRSRA